MDVSADFAGEAQQVHLLKVIVDAPELVDVVVGVAAAKGHYTEGAEPVELQKLRHLAARAEHHSHLLSSGQGGLDGEALVRR